MHGIPNRAITENWSQFHSQEFKSFIIAYDFKPITSSSDYPQSNGLLDNSVQIVKRLLNKAEKTIYILHY